jgi:ubiquinone/menaquinone biosynthesis C-methylase UbiE
MTTAGQGPTSERLRRDAVGRIVLPAPAEAIPLEDGSVDAVLATVVLCSLRSLRSPERAVAEVCRGARPVVAGPHIAGCGVR